VPASSERNIFSLRKQDGIKLYARKVLIQEYCVDLLPEFFSFVQGVVDSEDLPLNVSRETIQSSRIMGQLKKLITSKLIDALKNQGKDQPETYQKFWEQFGRFIKQGVATNPDYYEALLPLLRFHTMQEPKQWISLDSYIEGLKPEQKEIYYILGEDDRSVVYSPHLEAFKRRGMNVLLMTDPMDSFVLLRLNQYKDYKLVNVASNENPLPDEPQMSPEAEAEKLTEEASQVIIERIRQQLGERVSDVRTTTRLVESPARLVDKDGTMNPEMQRVYRLLNKEYEVPQKVIELNMAHPILKKLSLMSENDALGGLIIEQVYEDALLIEGLHPDPASMIERIQKLMEAALK
jgi:molecular chaperone HtpG